MRLFLLFALALTAALLWPPAAPRVAAQELIPPGSTELAANAAVQYWQAIVQMPSLDKDEEKLLADVWDNPEAWHKIPVDPQAQKLIADSQNSLFYLHRGARLQRCDWGLDYGDGISLLMPHLAKCRELARLAALRARSNFESGNLKAARDDAAAIMALSRHVGRDRFMICLLVRYLLEGMVVDLVSPYVPEIKVSHPQAVAMFDAMSEAATLQQAVSTERKYMAEWMIRKIREADQQKAGAGLELWHKFLDGDSLSDSIQRGKTSEQAIQLMTDTLPVYDQLAVLLALPNDQFDAQYPVFKKKTKDENPLAATLLPAIDKIRAKEQLSQARMAMLLAAIAFVEGGADKLKEIKDPFGDGPFEYKALDQGFELKSKLQFEGQPVTLVVGQRKK